MESFPSLHCIRVWQNTDCCMCSHGNVATNGGGNAARQSTEWKVHWNQTAASGFVVWVPHVNKVLCRGAGHSVLPFSFRGFPFQCFFPISKLQSCNMWSLFFPLCGHCEHNARHAPSLLSVLFHVHRSTLYLGLLLPFRHLFPLQNLSVPIII